MANRNSYDASPRIMGSETEYTTQFSLNGEFLSQLLSKRHYFPNMVGDSNRLWLRNGGRIYQEWNDLIEYATPECKSAEEVALYEKAGQATLRNVMTNFKSRLKTGEVAKAYKRSGYVSVFNHCGDTLLSPDSVGHHENYQSEYLYKNIDDLNKLHVAMSALSSYLSTRAIWSGAGLVNHDGYAVSQKGMACKFIHANGSNVNHGNKFAFVQRDSDRLEIRCGDGNMSEWAIIQKFAMTSLVLRLIEHGKFPQSQVLSKPSLFLNALSSSMDKNLVISSSDHQRSIALAGLEFAHSNHDVPKEEIAAAEAIITACDGIKTFISEPDSLDLLSDRIDWAAKLAHIQSMGFKQNEINTSKLDAVKHDLMWEDIGKRQPADKWYGKHQPSLFDAANVRRAQVYPPNTRAKIRCNILNDLQGYAQVIGWSSVSAYNYRVNLNDPAGQDLDEHGNTADVVAQYQAITRK